jgi:hypothetical protein
LAVPGCARTVDVRSPADRLTDDTAYTLRQGQVRLDTGLVGQDLRTDDLGANLGVRVGLHDRVELGTNLAHVALAYFNLDARVLMIDRPHFAWGARVGVRGFNGGWLYVVPPEQRSEISDLNLVVVPVDTTFTFPIRPWFDMHVTPGYSSVSAFGSFSDSTLTAEGEIGLRQVYIDTYFNFLIRSKVTLVFGVHWALYTAALTDADAVAEVEPGLEVGVQSGEWVRADPSEGWRGSAGVEWAFAKRSGVRLSLVYRRPVPGLPGFVVPAVNFHFRFGGKDRPGERAKERNP